MSERAAACSIAAWVALLACASPKLQPPEVSEAELEEEFGELGAELVEGLIELRARVRNVEYALTTSAARHCGSLSRPRAGAVLGNVESFRAKDLQTLAARERGWGEAPRVVHLVPHGSLARAGIRSGDVVLMVEGERVESGGELAYRLLRLGPRTAVRIRIEREGEERDVDVALDAACPVFVDVSNSPLIVPWQRKRLIVEIPLGLLRFTDSDDVLAVAIGHQLAHALFDRPEDEEAAAEARADRKGLMLVADAGYDVGVAPGYWEDVAREYPWLIGPTQRSRELRDRNFYRIDFNRYPHHDIARRMNGIWATVRRLQMHGTDTSPPPAESPSAR